MPPASGLDLQDRLPARPGQTRREPLAMEAHVFESGAIRRPDVDFPRTCPLVPQIHSPIQSARKSHRSDAPLVAKMHAVRLEESRDRAAELEEPGNVERIANHVNVEIAPRHQSKRVAADH